MVEHIKELLSGYPPFVQSFAKEIYSILLTPWKSGDRLHWIFLLSFVLMAALAYLYFRRERNFSFKRFVAFCFPPHIYRHPSAVMDYKLFVVNEFLPGTGRLTAFYTQVMVISFVTTVLTDWLGPRDGFPQTWWTMAACAIAFIVVSDFCDYVDHVMEHYIPFLWPIHKVHHSAEVLTPVTNYRMHPLTGVVSFPIKVTLMGILGGALFYVFQGKPTLMTIMGVNAVGWLANLLGGNLRHSHIWFSFGPVLSHIFVSPAQHQIHHSTAPEHINKNFGIIFAVWDWMFGTLYVPKAKEELVFGLGPSEPQPHGSLIRAYVEPLIEIGAMARAKLALPAYRGVAPPT